MKRSYVENMSSKMGWDNVLQRGFPQPLDRSSIFSSLEDAKAYASGGNDSRGLSQTSYVGQIITVFEDDNVDVYKINVDRELELVGEGKGIIFINNHDEGLNILNSDSKKIGNLFFNESMGIMYFATKIKNENRLLELFKINEDNGDVIYDCGTY